MKKWFAAAAFLLVAMTGVAWGCTGWSDAPLSAADDAAVTHPDPHFSAAAHRHFSGQTDRWGSMVLILD